MAQFTVDLSRFAAIARGSSLHELITHEALTLALEGEVAVKWAPFDHTPSTARLSIVGITPGQEQSSNALKAFRAALLDGKSDVDALRHAKLVGSFSGPMRNNIVKMLDSIGLQWKFNLPTCAALFDADHERVHFTSALRYPVFVNGANYNGTPDLLRTPLLRDMAETFLAEEVRALPGALWLPLGPKPTAALRHLVARGVLPADRLLEGMPHPSGANAERIKFFLGQKRRSDLSVKTRPDLIETARTALLAQVAGLQPQEA